MNKSDNNSCIKYLINNLEKYNEIIKGHLSLLELGNFLDLSKINQEFINIFKEAKFDEYFKSINIIIDLMIKKQKIQMIFILYFNFFKEKMILEKMKKMKKKNC